MRTYATLDGHHLDAGEERIEIHNHIPRAGDCEMQSDEAPAWFAEHQKSLDDRFKAMNSAMSELGKGLKAFFEQEAQEPEHAGDDDPDSSNPLWKGTGVTRGKTGTAPIDHSGYPVHTSDRQRPIRTLRDVNVRARELRRSGRW
jgi:hypothetical protein